MNPLNNMQFVALSRTLALVPCINEGGCGVSAYILYQFLRHNGWTDATIVYGYRASVIGRHSYDMNVMFLENNGGSPALSCTHAYVEIPSLMLSLDCNEVIEEIEPEEFPSLGLSLGYFLRVPHHLSDKFLVSSMFDREYWNCAFDRSHILPLAIFLENELKVPVPALYKIHENDRLLGSV